MVYNLTDGGDGIGKGFKWSEESKKKSSLARQGQKGYHTMKHVNKEKCGIQNKGKTWTTIDGKRVWKDK